MYQYTEYDKSFLQERVAEFREQTERRLNDQLTEDEYKQLRLRNGLYLQRKAYMLRVAIPYGLLSSEQLRKLGHIARVYDKDYGHITTRQNIQYNWPKLEQVPDLLAELADVEMHGIQTSGNCIRNTTTDPLAGAISDEIEDPRPWCELIRQWSTLHPEFNWLPRKFKIAVTGAVSDRAAVQVHDVGLRIVKNDNGETGFEVLVGGGLGRTPHIGQVINPFLPTQHLLTYLAAILRVYNLEGRRDNLYKARIKILVNALGIDTFREKVEAEWKNSRDKDDTFTQEQIDSLKAQFPTAPVIGGNDSTQPDQMFSDPLFNQWYQANTKAHRDSGRRIVFVSLKAPGQPAGDITGDQMKALADIADRFSLGEIRTTHEQNMVLARTYQ